jgi:predicted esterase
MAFRAGLRGARRASAVIAVGGDVPPELLAEPSVKFPRVLLIRGERDDWYTAGKLDADINALESRGVAVESFVHEGGHEWTAAVSRRAAEFVHNGSGRRPEVG